MRQQLKILIIKCDFNIQQFPDHNFDETYSKYSTTSTSRTNMFPQLSDLQICPARSSEELTIEEDSNFDGANVSPWSVKQTDSHSKDFEVILLNIYYNIFTRTQSTDGNNF